MTSVLGGGRPRNEARVRHPTARSKPDGRGPRRPPGRRTHLFLMLFSTGVFLMALGLVMVLSASSVDSLYSSATRSSWFYFQRQLIWLSVGLVAMLATMRIHYDLWRRLAQPLMIVCLALLVAVLVPGVGTTVLGARRWIGFGPFTFQPSELAKLALVVFAAEMLSRPRRSPDDIGLTLKPIMVVVFGMSVLLMREPDLGTTILVGLIALTMLFVAGNPLRHLFALASLGGVLAAALALAAPYRRARLTAFLHPDETKADTGYQLMQSLAGIATGGLTGVGLGQSRAKWGYLPFAHTDFIFAVVAEEFGLIGAGFVLGAFAAIGVLGVLVAVRAPDRFGMLLAAGITAWIMLQTFVNIGGVIGVLPITGVTLPLVSAGGSSLVITMAAFGILLNIARHARSSNG